MKKVVYIAIIALCIFLLLLVLFFIIRSNNSIPIVSNLSWNSTPKQVSHIFGKSYNKVKNSGDTGKNIYYYKADILGEEATIECLFLYDIFLTDVYITWNNCSPDIYNKAYECLYSYYCNKKGFFEENSEEIENNYQYCCIGTNNGATGIRYVIERKDTSVSIICINHS